MGLSEYSTNDRCLFVDNSKRNVKCALPSTQWEQIWFNTKWPFDENEGRIGLILLNITG